MYISIGKVANLFGVAVSTIRLWEKLGKLSSDFRTLGGHRRYNLSSIIYITTKKLSQMAQPEIDHKQLSTRHNVIAYVRVSGTKQKKELQTQVDQIQQYVQHNGWQLTRVYRDIASGLNDQRKGLLQLLTDIPVDQPYALLTTYPDRLARFGQSVLQTFCDVFSCKLISIFVQDQISSEQQLVDDMISLATSFAGKLHRQRRGRQLLVSEDLLPA